MNNEEKLIITIQRLLREYNSTSDNVPHGLKKIINDGLWKHRDPAPGKLNPRDFDSFVNFCEHSSPYGLNVRFDTIKLICSKDNEALNLIDKVTKRKAGKTWDSRTVENTLYNIQDNSAPTGDTKQAALRRLRKDRPDLLEQVIEDKMSANQAMIEAGFRIQKITMPKGRNAKRWIEVIIRDFSEEDRVFISDNII